MSASAQFALRDVEAQLVRDRRGSSGRGIGGSQPTRADGAPTQLLPGYRPGPGQLPPSLRLVRGDELGFHFTEPELAERIVRTSAHLPTRLGAGRHGIYVTRHGPHTDSAATMLGRVFNGRFDASPKLWAVLAAELYDHQTAEMTDDGSAELAADVLMTSVSAGCFAAR